MAWAGSGVFGQTMIVDPLGTTQLALDLDLDTHKIALFNNTVTPNYSATTPVYSATGEIVGTGYTAHGKIITGTVLSQAAGIATWDGDDISWPTSTLSGVRGALVNADNLAGDPLIVGFDFLTAYDTSDGTLLLTVNPLGLVTYDFVP